MRCCNIRQWYIKFGRRSSLPATTDKMKRYDDTRPSLFLFYSKNVEIWLQYQNRNVKIRTMKYLVISRFVYFSRHQDVIIRVSCWLWLTVTETFNSDRVSEGIKFFVVMGKYTSVSVFTLICTRNCCIQSCTRLACGKHRHRLLCHVNGKHISHACKSTFEEIAGNRSFEN
jgi:hypothetical protein